MGTCYDKTYTEEEFKLEKGDLLGEFKLGSTVALVYEVNISIESINHLIQVFEQTPKWWDLVT